MSEESNLDTPGHEKLVMTDNTPELNKKTNQDGENLKNIHLLTADDSEQVTTGYLKGINQDNENARNESGAQGKRSGMKNQDQKSAVMEMETSKPNETRRKRGRPRKNSVSVKNDSAPGNKSQKMIPQKKRKTQNSLSTTNSQLSQLIATNDPLVSERNNKPLEQHKVRKTNERQHHELSEDIKEEIVTMDIMPLISDALKRHSRVAAKNAQRLLEKVVEDESDSEKKHVSKLGKRIGRPPKFGEYKCKYCDFVATEKGDLRKHQKNHSTPPKRCKYCDFETKSKQIIIEHEAKHTNDRPFKCQLCPFECRYRADLYHHQAKHETEKKYHCPQEDCNFTTKWRRNIRHHMRRHTDARPFSCHICKMAFKQRQDLRYHIYRHTDEKPLKCDLCDFRCKTNFEIKCHRVKHSDERKFGCTFPGCTSRTKTKSDMTKHMKTHTEEKNFVCETCGKAFKTQTALNKHKKRHSDVRPYACDICNKTFKFRPGLRNHLYIHTGVRPYSCEVCGQTFSSKSNKSVHMKTHDYSNRPFRCALCPYAAQVQAHLLAHIGSYHSSSYAYFCEICKKPFKRFGHLKLHQERMHTKHELQEVQGTLDQDKSNIKKEMKVELLDQEEFENISSSETSYDKIEKNYSDNMDTTDVTAEENLSNEDVNTNSGIGMDIMPKTKESNQSNVIKRKGIAKHTADSPSICQKRNEEDLTDKLTVNNGGEIESNAVENNYRDESFPISLTERIFDEEKYIKTTEIVNNCPGQSDASKTPATENSEAQSKAEIVENATPATLAIYDGFRLPLATKGFEFNFEKKGKKPKCWFMDPSNMNEEARLHHHKYLERKKLEDEHLQQTTKRRAIISQKKNHKDLRIRYKKTLKTSPSSKNKWQESHVEEKELSSFVKSRKERNVITSKKITPKREVGDTDVSTDSVEHLGKQQRRKSARKCTLPWKLSQGIKETYGQETKNGKQTNENTAKSLNGSKTVNIEKGKRSKVRNNQKNESSSPLKAKMKDGRRNAKEGKKAANTTEDDFVIEWETEEQMNETYPTSLDSHNEYLNILDTDKDLLCVKQETTECESNDHVSVRTQGCLETTHDSLQHTQNQVLTFCDDIVVMQKTSGDIKTFQSVATDLVRSFHSNTGNFTDSMILNSGNSDTNYPEIKEDIVDEPQSDILQNISVQAEYLSTVRDSESGSMLLDVKTEPFDSSDRASASPALPDNDSSPHGFLLIKQEPPIDQEYFQTMYG